MEGLLGELGANMLPVIDKLSSEFELDRLLSHVVF